MAKLCNVAYRLTVEYDSTGGRGSGDSLCYTSQIFIKVVGGNSQEMALAMVWYAILLRGLTEQQNRT